jgi:hypothetical protein
LKTAQIKSAKTQEICADGALRQFNKRWGEKMKQERAVELGTLLQTELENLVSSGTVGSRRDNFGSGGVWVPGIQNGAMGAVLEQMAEAGFLSGKAKRALKL